MTTRIDSPIDQRPSTLTPTMWRVAGGLALAHVVILFAGFSQEVSVEHGITISKLGSLFGGADLNRVLAGGYVESLAFLVLLPALVFVARALGQRSPLGRWAAMTGLAAGITYVAITLAVGQSAGAAALYGAQHGADLHAVAMVLDVRNYAFFLSVAVSGAYAIAVGLSAIADGRFTRWVGYGGVVVGVVAIVAVAAQFANVGSLLWMIWWVGVAVTLIRAAGTQDTVRDAEGMSTVA